MAKRFSVEAVFKAVDRISAPISRMQNRVGKFARTSKRAIRGVNKAIRGMATSFKNASVRALKFGTVGIAAAATGLALLVKQFTKIEDAEARFTPLMRGAEGARKLVEALNDTAATTPFKFEALANATALILPAMKQDIGKTVDLIRTLGDMAGGSAQRLDTLARATSKVFAGGRAQLEEINMLTDAGIPILDELAKVMGAKGVPRLRKMITAGKVSVDIYLKAISNMTSATGLFFNGMEVASKTTTGLLSTLSDNISLTAAALGEIMAPTIKDLIRIAIGWAQQMREWVKLNKELISEKFLKFVGEAKVGILKLVEGVKQLHKFFNENKAAIVGWTVAIGGLAIAINAVGIALGVVALAVAINPFVLLGGAIIGVIAAAATFVPKLKAAFAGLPRVIQIILAPFRLLIMALEKIRDLGKLAFSGIPEFLAGKAEALGSSILEGPTAQAVTPAERTAAAISETNTTNTSEVTIRDETGRAEVTGGKLGSGISLTPSGAF